MSTILIVDDDAMTLRMLEYTLKGGGHEVVATSNPEGAAHLAASHEVDAVILDILMPGRSGFEVLSELQGCVSTARVPVVMLSSLSKSADRVKGLKEGAQEYINKPFDPEELLLRLNRLLSASPVDPAAFQGRLSTVSFAEVAQSLINGGKSGSLEVQTAAVRGSVRVSGGVPIESNFGRLEGMEAVLAMLGLECGAFRFLENTDQSGGAAGEALPIQQAIFSAAWIEDEMKRWPEVKNNVVLWPLDDDQAMPQIPAGLDLAPLAEVLKEVGLRPGVTVRDLVAREIAAPRRIELGVRILVSIGAVRVVPGGDPRDGEESGCNVGLAQATQEILDIASTQGPSRDLVYVLVLVEPSVYAKVLNLRQEVPSDAIAGKADSLTVAWRSGRAAALPLRAASGQIVVHFAPLDIASILEQVRNRMDDYACVVLWVGDEGVFGPISQIITSIEISTADQWGLVVAEHPESVGRVGSAVEGCFKWQVHEGEVRDVAELLHIAARVAPGV